jgi:hypothetical protein
MQRKTKRVLVLCMTLVFITLSPLVSPENEMQARPLAEPLSLSVVPDQKVVVDVLVRNAPVVYGIDVRLSFDPDFLEAVDAEGSAPPVQLEHGDFFDPAQSHVLQNWAVNDTGTIDYALALLNPALPVDGDGRLARIQFRAIAAGQTLVSIDDGLFGTQAGDTIPALPHLVLVTPPIVDAGPDQQADEGNEILVTAQFSDPDSSDTHTATIDWGDSTVTEGFVGGGVVTGTHVYVDEGVNTVTVEVCDNTGGCNSDDLSVTVANVAPIVGEIIAPFAPLLINTTITTSADFTDPGVLDTHTATWDWGDGDITPGIVQETGGSGTVTGDHTYTTQGVFTLDLAVEDNDGGVGGDSHQYIVVYNPEGGFVTGGGWIMSPAGAYPADPSLTGKANFGLNSKYHDGATIPTGQTHFNFKAGNCKLHSEAYEWLVVFGARAWYKGTGRVNGESGYHFLVTAIDGDIDPNDDIEEDLFRIKIWSEDANGVEIIIYDNGFGSPDYSEDWATELGGGSIVIHHGS